MNFASTLYENPDDMSMATGWCHPKQECIVLARLNGLNVVNGRKETKHLQDIWFDNIEMTCCGCGKPITRGKHVKVK